MPTTIVTATENLNRLAAFRQVAYAALGPARDALFELGDAVLLTVHANSFAEFSLSPAFRRKWPSVYEALQDGRLDRAALVRLYLDQMVWVERPILVGDHTAWPRLEAHTLQDRTIEHQPTPVRGATPITVGQGYSTLAWVPESRGSWALPLLHERIASESSPIQMMVAQLRHVCPRLDGRSLVLLDAEYGCAPFVKASADIPCDKLMRLRSNLCLRTAPSPYSGSGRPAKHGRKFKFRDARTWGTPTDTLELNDPDLGHIVVRLWANLHFLKAPEQPLWVMHIERPHARGTRRDPRTLWLAWCGEPLPPLGESWRMYFRRPAVDHWYRFAKHSLFWTLPRFKTPEQAERWSDLMPLLTWELWLARPAITDKPLPWQKPQTTLTPGRVRQSLGALFAQIGTPAHAPKPRGKSLGWPKGRPRAKASRYTIVKKRPKRHYI
jgi:hypothetical protein